MNDTDLTPPAVLDRAANIITAHGHAKEEFHTKDGYCSAGAIGKACGLDPEDWNDGHHFAPAILDYEDDQGGFHGDAYDADLQAWKARRQAALDAARTLTAYITPDVLPEQMSRRELSEHIGDWNDHPDRTADHAIEAMRAAAQAGVPGRG